MREQRKHKPPAVYAGMMRLAAVLVPERVRREWRQRWQGGLEDCWELSERGEMAGLETAELSRYCRAAFADALWQRFNRQRLRWWLRGPACLLAAFAAALAGLAAVSGGFALTSSIAASAIERYGTVSRHSGYDPVSDRLVGYLLPVAFALAVGLMATIVSGLSMQRRGWKYWAFLAAKTSLVMLTLPLAWIEGGSLLRAWLPGQGLKVLLGGFVLALAFVGAFGWAMAWNVADQKRRCPVCLHTLALPVRVGSWSSMLEPAVTEMLCEEGHGALSVPENDLGEPERWVEMDASWRELFEPAVSRR
jgi:hypothetical protein